mmetsp:Transcript_15913/g.34097  ORF Transcript_15913/g.34097 Transcript_15913/m.34097 type:complete len:464 (-) Transcript_15913:1448-2839(-)
MQNLKVEGDGVDGQAVLPGVVLESPGEERLWEEEARDPKDGRRPVVDPALHKRDPLHQVVHPAAERLQRRVGRLGPDARHLVGVEGVRHRLELGRHDHEALQRLEQRRERTAEDVDELVVPDALLREHRVHRLFVEQRVGDADLGQREGTQRPSLQLECHLLDDILPVPPSAARRLWLQRHHDLAELVGLVLGARNVGVLVQPKDVWVRTQRHRHDDVHVLRHRPWGRRVVLAPRRDLEFVIHDALVDDAPQQRHDHPSVPVVGDAPAVIDVAKQVDEHLVGNLVVSREECLELQNATLEVASGELVADVEPKRTKLAPVLQQRMEAAQPVQQLLKFLPFRVRVEVRIGEVVVRSEQIHFDATRRFDGHFDRILEDKHWEFVRWHRREPKSVVAVHLVWIVLLDERLELGHPARGEVTVLKQDPRPPLYGLAHEAFGNRALPLPQRDCDELLREAHLVCEFQK